MPVSFDVQADATGVTDGGELLTLHRSAADDGDPVTAWRIDRTVTRSPAVLSITTVWGTSIPVGDPSPQPGGYLTDPSGEAAIITRVEAKRADARLLVTTLHHELDAGYSEYLDIETPSVDPTSGATRWSTVAAAEWGVVLAADPIDQPSESHTVVMLRRLDVKPGDRVYGHRSGYFRVLRPAGEPTIGAPCEVAVERFDAA